MSSKPFFFCLVNKRVLPGVLHEGIAARGRLAVVLKETGALWQFGRQLNSWTVFQKKAQELGKGLREG